MFILKKGHQPGVYVPLRALFLVIFFFPGTISMYPAFVNCTTIDWFSEWPLDALLELADKYVSRYQIHKS